MNINKKAEFMRHITQDGVTLIKRFEGVEPEIYFDAAGLPTISYGHLLRPGEAEMFKNGITPLRLAKHCSSKMFYPPKSQSSA